MQRFHHTLMKRFLTYILGVLSENRVITIFTLY
eukprot:UN08511